MAIQSTYFSTIFHVELPESYNKINNVRINDNVVSFDVLVYTSKEARERQAQPVANLPFGVSLVDLNAFEGDNIIAKLYDCIKRMHPMYQVEGVTVTDV